MTYGRQTRDTRGRIVRWDFDDVDQLVCQAEQPVKRYGASRSSDESFTGTPSFDVAVSLARTGWPGGVEMVKKAIADLPPVAGRGVARGYDVAGAYPVAARAAAGMPDAMRTRKRDAGMRPVVRLGVDICVTGGTSQDEIIQHGANVLSVIDSIEQRGSRVEIVAVASTRGAIDRVVRVFSVVLKRAQDPYNLDTLAFWLIHPSAFRRLMFGVWDSTKDLNGMGVERYGPVVGVPSTDDLQVVPSAAHYNNYLRRDARAELIRWFEQRGIQVAD